MLELHRKLLGDSVRNAAFAEALKKSVVPGKSVVVDVGAGTGLLSFLAEKYGAKECWLIESGEVISLARVLGERNAMKQCHYVHKNSCDVRQELKADIVISETLGNHALEENIIEILRDAKRFLAPKGVMIPSHIAQFVAPVVSRRLYDEINVWDRVGYGLDFSEAKRMAQNAMYVKTILPSDISPLPPDTKMLESIDLRANNDSIRSRTIEWTFGSDATVYGYALWWECELIPGITLSTSPHNTPTHWEQIYLPVLDPIKVNERERLILQYECDTTLEIKINVGWNSTVWSKDNIPISHTSMNMQDGYFPLSR